MDNSVSTQELERLRSALQDAADQSQEREKVIKKLEDDNVKLSMRVLTLEAMIKNFPDEKPASPPRPKVSSSPPKPTAKKTTAKKKPKDTPFDAPANVPKGG